MPSDTKKRDYSRTEYVFGKEALAKMQSARFLVVGLGGTGVEIAKNLILTGANAVVLSDNKPVNWVDLSGNCFLSEAHLGQNRAAVCHDSLQELNPHCKVSLHTGPLTPAFVLSHSCVVFSEMTPEFPSLAEQCHANNIPIVLGTSAGLCGRVFSDFGEEFVVHDVDGERVDDLAISHVTLDKIEGKNRVFVTTTDGHNLSTDYTIHLRDIRGSGPLPNLLNEHIHKVEVTSFNMLEVVVEGGVPADIAFEYERGGYLKRVKQPKTVSFSSYGEACENPTFPDDMIDFSKFGRNALIHKLFMQLDSGPTPAPWNPEHEQAMLQPLGLAEEDKEVAHLFAATCAGVLAPVVYIVGGWAAQEALKAVSGKYMPIRQFYYFDCFEALPEALPTTEDAAPRGCRYDGQIAVFGAAFQEKLAAASLFMVGAGALGCELLKLFAMTGVSTQEGSMLHVTDPDTIENSNLSRQFLFREGDISKLKSEVAVDRAKLMNPDIRAESMSLKVGPDTEGILNRQFWASKRVIVNALDNLTARRYVDSRCVMYGLPLLESGTLGQKANNQDIIPNVTESYSSTSDPENSDPHACTVHNFPNTMTHCIVYARSEFEGLFSKPASDVRSWYERDNFIAELEGETTTRLKRLAGILDLVSSPPSCWHDCVVWARGQFDTFFHNKIQHLLNCFPLDSVDKDGHPFWSSSKRPPTAIVYDPSNPHHATFVGAAAKIYGNMFAIPEEPHAHVIAADVPALEFASEAKAGDVEDGEVADIGIKLTWAQMVEQLPARDTVTKIPEAVSFEKDDPTNGHIDLIAAFSNLRANNYSIPESPASEIRRIAGSIIPAMITTTALIVGHVGVELYKAVVHEEHPIEHYRSVFINVALPLCQQSEPGEVSKQKITTTGETVTIWSNFDIDATSSLDIQLDTVIEQVEERYQCEVEMVVYGQAILFAPWGSSAARRTQPVIDLCRSVGKLAGPMPEMVSLVMSVIDGDGADIEIPPVRIIFK
eukprot:gnl/Dysnectes_brevis/742_a815_3218.p1 GENE.gnl/Dysnectes_brevis/742_a815_3218~~gnl/Dysnectes_brevis/742_a815_3218.p1  ORF type:complete len:995 (+),score=447.52 gnl/Dysnectes_brevis/742_a815_3218:51-3035(+)